MIVSGTLEETIDSLNEIKGRLGVLGVNMASGRVTAYLDALCALSVKIKAQGALWLQQDDAGRYSNVICDSILLIELFKSPLPKDAVFVEKLKQAVAGPVSPIDEKGDSASNLARNTLFELIMAARVARAGMIPELEKPTDVAGNFVGGRLFIECKRIQTTAKLESRLKEGAKKVADAKKSFNGKSVGFVAVAVGKAIFEGHKVVVFENPEHMSEVCEQLCENYFRKNIRQFQRAFQKGADGIIIDISFAAWTGTKMQITPCSYISFRVPKNFPESIAKQLIRGFGIAMSKLP